MPPQPEAEQAQVGWWRHDGPRGRQVGEGRTGGFQAGAPGKAGAAGRRAWLPAFRPAVRKGDPYRRYRGVDDDEEEGEGEPEVVSDPPGESVEDGTEEA